MHSHTLAMCAIARCTLHTCFSRTASAHCHAKWTSARRVYFSILCAGSDLYAPVHAPVLYSSCQEQHTRSRARFSIVSSLLMPHDFSQQPVSLDGPRERSLTRWALLPPVPQRMQKLLLGPSTRKRPRPAPESGALHQLMLKACKTAGSKGPRFPK